MQTSESNNHAPGMGERLARMGYGAQDRQAAALILDALRSKDFQLVRLADLDAGKVDDFVLVWSDMVWGNSVKWSGTDAPLSWAEFCGADTPLIQQLADGWLALKARWPNKNVRVYLRTSRVPSDGTHGNQIVPHLSLRNFLSIHWDEYRRGNSTPSEQLAGAWERVQQRTGLTDEQFREFILSGCYILTELPKPGPYPADGLDAEQWNREFDALRQAINDWVESNPDASDFLAEDIRRAIGLTYDQLLIVQGFPEPEIGYEQNEQTFTKLREAINGFDRGYIALVGPAGAGKSTLANKLFQREQFGVRYFAYIPSGQADPAERGDALAFYRYVISVLDHWEPTVRKAHGISDLAQAKESFRLHMARIGERYREIGRKTLILIDGLDHITREPGLAQPLQSHLPSPDEVGEGCIILISAQPQALSSLRSQIRTQLGETRKVTISQLPEDAILRILSIERLERDLSPEDKKLVSSSCRGNPLILTYLVKSIRRTLDRSVSELISEFGAYEGEIDVYYEERFCNLLDDLEIKHLLALLCRVRGRVRISWLQTWPEWGRFEQLYQRHINAFMDIANDGLGEFVHNSLVSYLLRRTRPTIPGSDAAAAERQWNRELAERCLAGTSCLASARDKIYYEAMADEHASVLNTATIEWFRVGFNDFVPPVEMHPLIGACGRSAVAMNDYGALLRFLALSKELEQRGATVSILDLAQHFLDLNQPNRAIEQIVNGLEIHVEPFEVLIFCQSVASFAQQSEDDKLFDSARQLFDLAKPVELLSSSVSVETHAARDSASLLSNWAAASAYFLTPYEFVTIIKGLKFIPTDLPNPEMTEASLCFSYLKTYLRRGLVEDVSELINFIDEYGESDYSFWSRLSYVDTLQRIDAPYSEALKDLKQFSSLMELDGVDKLMMADCLTRSGNYTEAIETIRNVTLPVPEAYPDMNGKSPLGGVWARIRLCRLRSMLGLEPLPPHTVADEDHEAAGRVAVACAQLGELWGIVDRDEIQIDGLKDKFVSLLGYYAKPLSFNPSWNHISWALTARNEIYTALTDLAGEIGIDGAQALRAAVETVDQEPSQLRPDDRSLRMFACSLHSAGAFSATDALEIVRRSTSDASNGETTERFEACFRIAKAFHHLGSVDECAAWTKRAGLAAHGIGYHKDYQMVDWAAWLERSLDATPQALGSSVVQLMAQSLEIAGGDGGSYARRDFMRSCFQRSPLIASRLAIEMIDRGQSNLGTCLESAILGTPIADANPELLGAIFSRLYSLIEPHPNADVAAAIISAGKSDSKRLDLAQKCASALRTNSPAETRAALLRSISDELRRHGQRLPDELQDEVFESPQDSISSSSWLYKLNDGRVRSLSLVASYISDPTQEADWNPNPDDNKYLAWDEVMGQVKVRSRDHLAAIEKMFVRGEQRRDAKVVAALAIAAGRMGDASAAADLAERARHLASDGGWLVRLDGAAKKTVFAMLISINHHKWLGVARREFENDLLSGRVGTYSLLSEIGEIFDLLEWNWPRETVLQVIESYLKGLTASVTLPDKYVCLSQLDDIGTGDEGLCHLLVGLFAHPIKAVATAARIVCEDHLISNGEGLFRAFSELAPEDTIIAEQALLVLDVVVRRNSKAVETFRPFVLERCSSHSIAVRSISHRICLGMGWAEPPSVPRELPGIFDLLLPEEGPELRRFLRHQAEEIRGSEFGLALELYSPLIRNIAEHTGYPIENLMSQARRHYKLVSDHYTWSKEKDARLHKWRDAIPALTYTAPRATVAREAVMRLIDDLEAAGELGDATLDSYDKIAPAYDGKLEQMFPSERPPEILGIQIDGHSSKLKEWAKAFSQADLLSVPSSIGDGVILAERSQFRRPEWDWPKEERRMCPVPNYVPLSAIGGIDDLLPPFMNVTYAQYREHSNERVLEPDIAVWCNIASDLTTPAAKWLALNPAVGNTLNWQLSHDGLFRWTDFSGQVMVESKWWRDGWTEIDPPKSRSVLSEGWLVLCSLTAYEAIQSIIEPSRLVLCGRRSCKGSDGGRISVEQSIEREM